MPTWINDDGLEIKTGRDEAALGNVAGYRTNGRLRVVEIVVDADVLPTVAEGSTVITRKVVLPSGARIEKVEKSAESETFVGSGATLSIGLVDADDGTSNTDKDAIVDAATVAELNGDTAVALSADDSGWGGAVLGTVLSASKYLIWEVDTAEFSAGRCTFEIHFSIPKDASDTLVYTKS